MARAGGNPDIREISKHSTGPTSEIGKLKATLSRYKTIPKISKPLISKDSMAAKAVGYDGSEEKLQAYYNFVDFVLGRSVKELSEIQKLESLMAVLEMNLVKLIERISNGEEMKDPDRKNMFLMKDILVDLNRIKFGEKHVNINADIKDIRDMMFDDN